MNGATNCASESTAGRSDPPVKPRSELAHQPGQQPAALPPVVLLDDDGDLWIDLKGTGEYRYLSPYAALGPAKSLEELRKDYPYLSVAEWTNA